MRETFQIGDLWFSVDADRKIMDAIVKRKRVNNLNADNDIAIQIQCVEVDSYTCSNKDFLKRQDPVLTFDGMYREIEDVGLFCYDRKKKEIIVHCVLESDQWQDNCEIIADTIFQFMYLSLMDYGYLPLHAAAVETPSGLIIIMGKSGQGKSTALMSMLATNCTFFADDVIFVNKNTLRIVSSGEHVISLTPEGLNTWTDVSTDVLVPNHEKTILPIEDLNKRQTTGASRAAEIIFPIFTFEGINSCTFTKMTENETLWALTENTISKNFPLERKKDYFSVLLALSKNVSGFHLVRNRDYPLEKLVEVCARHIQKE